MKTMLGFKIFEFVWTGQLSYPQYLARAKSARIPPVPVEPPPLGETTAPVQAATCVTRGGYYPASNLSYLGEPRENARARGKAARARPPSFPRVRVFLSRVSRTSTFNDIPKRRACSLATILVKTFGTLCVLGEENVLQVDSPPP